MKRVLLFLAALLSASLLFAQQQSLVFAEEHPQPGEKITFKYNPSATTLAGTDDFQAYAYLLEGKLPLIQEVPLKKEGDRYIGQVATNDSTRAIIVQFRKDEKLDNNNGSGYHLMLHRNGKPVPGAHISLATAFYGHHSITHLDGKDQFVPLMKQEFEQYPASREKFKADYWRYLRESRTKEDSAELKAQLQQALKSKAVTEEDLANVRYYYERVFKDSAQLKATDAAMKKRFPATAARNALAEQVRKETDPAKKEALFRELQAKYPAKNEQQRNNDNSLAYSLANAHLAKEDLKKALFYADKIEDPSWRAQFYNSVAWKQAGEGMEGKPGNIELGLELSGKSMELMRAQKADRSKKPNYLTEAQWQKNLEQGYQTFADTYAVLLYHKGEHEKAYEMLKEAVAAFEGKYVDINQNLAFVAEKARGPEEATRLLAGFVEEGHYNVSMKEQLKRLYSTQHGAAAWSSYIAKLEQAAREKKREELIGKMISQPAPAFALKDLKGNTVSLASLKGKTVVVDFWATWCGPCRASFPGMQKAVDKYKDDPNVVFLFIDTWEGGDKREKMVTEFIEKNKYTFNVLYDEARKENPDEFTVVSNFKVEGIPTKFVIDGNHNIRFKSVGYSGNPDALVDELSLMIELAGTLATGNSQNATEKKKAF